MTAALTGAHAQWKAESKADIRHFRKSMHYFSTQNIHRLLYAQPEAPKRVLYVTGYDNMTDVGLVWDKRDWSIQEHE